MSINIHEVKKAIGIPDFKRTDLLEIALTHPSRIYENKLTQEEKDRQEREYRRMAILGDSIFNAVVIDYLVSERFPNLNQGEITKIKSQIVSRKQHSEFARNLQLKKLCLLGKGEISRDESGQVELFGEMFEALLSAIYLEFNRDFSRFREWLVKRFIEEKIEHLLGNTQIIEQPLPEDNVLTFADTKLLQMKQEADRFVDKDETLQQLLTWITQKARSVDPAYEPAKVRAFYLALVRVLSFDFAKAFEDPTRRRSFARSFSSIFNRARGLALNLAFDFDAKNVLLCLLALDLEPQLTQAMQELEAELPEPDKEAERFDEWRQNQGQAWVKKLTTLIGHNLQFNEQQTELLKEYYKANKSLMEYLNSGCDVSTEVREDIEEELFLPKRLMK